MMRFLLSTALGLCLALPAHARTVTLTFDDAPTEEEYYTDGDTPYVEGGVTILNAVAWSPGLLHLDDYGTPFPNTLEIFTGGSFTPLRAAILGLGQSSMREVPDGEGWFDLIPTAYDNVILQGYRGGDLVAFDSYSTGLEFGWHDYVFPTSFRDIDSLWIVNSLELMPTDVRCDDAPCAHISVDDLQIALAPVSLPASGGLLFGAMAMLGLRRRFRNG